MVLVIEDNGVTYFGTNAANLKSSIDLISERDLLNPINLNIFPIEGAKNAIIGFADNGLACDVVRFAKKLFPEDITFEELTTNIVPKIEELFGNYLLLDKYGTAPGAMVIAQKGKSYYINSSFAVFEIKDYFAIGEHDADVQLAYHILGKTKAMNPIERITYVFEEMGKCLYRVPYPIIVLDTKTKEYKTIKK